METDEYRILGLPADATEEQIRQSYLDLIRVWHPDRFQGDAHLRQIAEEHTQRINKAYAALKNRRRRASRFEAGDAGSEGSRARSARAGRAEERGWRPDNTPRTGPVFFAGLSRAVWARLVSSRLTQAIAVLILCATPFLTALRILTALRVPALDLDLIASHRPQILMPARIIDPASEVRIAADALAEWARGEVIDLWKPLFWNPRDTPIRTTRVIPAQVPAISKPINHHRQSAVASEASFANGTELLVPGRLSGTGEILLVNNSELDEVATLMRRKSPLRAVYVKAHDRAFLRSIGVGFYDVYLELGRSLDPERLRFRRNRFAPDPLGPFEFFEVISANGPSGQHYEVVVNPP